MKKYKVLKEYPGSPKEGIVLTLFAPLFGFTYYRDKHCKFRLSKEIVENYPEYYEKILTAQEQVENMDLGFKRIGNTWIRE